MQTGTSSGADVHAEDPTRPRPGPLARWPRSSDTAIAATVLVLEVVGIVGQKANESGEFSLSLLAEISAATYLLLAVSSIALLWRRRWPLVVLGVALLASLVWDIIGLEGGASLAILVSLYGVGRYTEENTSFLALAGAAVLVVANDLIEGEPISVMGLSLLLVAVAWYVGRRTKERRQYLALLEERAEYLERERAAEAQRAVDEERARIARELHDVVAHRVSMITVQAGAAQTVVGNDPERAARAMEAVEREGREALHELREVLGVLRADNSLEGLAPIHGSGEIPGLVEDMRRAGMDVSLTDDGRLGDLPARVGLASYRIVQEALTNVLKHAGTGAKAEVRLYSDDQMLTIEVLDQGVGAITLPGSGQGLVGMRERATLLGGTFEAGPRLDGGYRVVARLPMERSPS